MPSRTGTTSGPKYLPLGANTCPHQPRTTPTSTRKCCLCIRIMSILLLIHLLTIQKTLTYRRASLQLLDGKFLEVLNRRVHITDRTSARDVTKVLNSVQLHWLVARIIDDGDGLCDLFQKK